MNGQQKAKAKPAPDKLDWESAWRWGLSCPNLKLPKQSTHPCLYMKAMRWEGSTVRVWCCSSPMQLQARVNTLFKDEQSSLKGKPWSFQPSQEGHKWVQETRGDLHKGNELNLAAHEWGPEQTGPCAPALGTDFRTNTWEAAASLELLFLKLQDYYLIFLPNTATAIKTPVW